MTFVTKRIGHYSKKWTLEWITRFLTDIGLNNFNTTLQYKSDRDESVHSFQMRPFKGSTLVLWQKCTHLWGKVYCEECPKLLSYIEDTIFVKHLFQVVSTTNVIWRTDEISCKLQAKCSFERICILYLFQLSIYCTSESVDFWDWKKKIGRDKRAFSLGKTLFGH